MSECIRINKGDTYKFDYRLRWSDGNNIDLSDATKVEFILIKDGTETLRKDMVIGPLGKVSYAWESGETDTPGMYLVKFVITDTNGKKLTVPTGELQWLWIVG